MALLYQLSYNGEKPFGLLLQTTTKIAFCQKGYTYLMNEIFRKIAHSVSRVTGSAWTFCLAVVAVLAWAVTGPYFGFSNTWQLFINTGTTILTFLMVFLIQNNQNRDSQATQLKLDELIKALGRARNEFVDIEEDKEDKLKELEDEFKKVHEKAEKRL